MTNQETRIARLKTQLLPSPEYQLVGVLFLHEGSMVVDGKFYSSRDDVPDDLRKKYGGNIGMEAITQGKQTKEEIERAEKKGNTLLKSFKDNY